MRTELSRRSRIDLSSNEQSVPCVVCYTYVELVEFSNDTQMLFPNRFSVCERLRNPWKQRLSNDINDAYVMRIEIGRKLIAVELGGLSIRLVQHFLALFAESSRRAVLQKFFDSSLPFFPFDDGWQGQFADGLTVGEIPA